MTVQGVRLRELPPGERPRERLARLGAAALSNAELLAILLRTGDRAAGCSALGLAQRLLALGSGWFPGDERAGMRFLSTVTVAELAQVPGVGLAKAAQVKAGVELGRRVAAQEVGDRPELRNPAAVAGLLRAELQHQDQERFVGLLVDTKRRVVSVELIAVGGLDTSPAQPREVFRAAVRKNAHAMILGHNHPSGDPAPSRDDIAMTRRLAEAGRLLGIEVLDHVIIGENTYVSFRQNGIRF